VLHGEPAVRRVTFGIRSKPVIGSRKKLLVPGYTSVNRAAEYLEQVQAVKATGWPLCARCVRQRTLGLVLTNVLFFGGLAVFAATFVTGAVADPPAPVLVVMFLGGLAAILLAVVPLQRASLPRLSRAEVTPDGAAVQVSDPSPEFTAQLPPEGQQPHRVVMANDLGGLPADTSDSALRNGIAGRERGDSTPI
jgi:hypothetical protein